MRIGCVWRDVPTTKDLIGFPSVEDTIDVAREDAEANVPTAVATPKEVGAVEQSRHELTHNAAQELVLHLRRRKRSGRPSPEVRLLQWTPRVVCEFMFLSSSVHLANPGLAIFNIIDRESQLSL